MLVYITFKDKWMMPVYLDEDREKLITYLHSRFKDIDSINFCHLDRHDFTHLANMFLSYNTRERQIAPD